jgi:CBS domain-containing protein
MFDANVTCERQEVRTGTVQDLRKHFKKLAAVHHVEATGTLDGTFHLFFDQDGLFILAGFMVMLPEQRIQQEVKRGSVDEAEGLTDAVCEVGNLLVGSWDCVYREGLKGHGHFLKTGTFIGKLWENTNELSIPADEELMFVVYVITVEPYKSFRCAAVFPKATIGRAADASVAPSPPPDNQAQPSARPQQAAPAAPPETAETAAPQTAPAEQSNRESVAEPADPAEIPADIRSVVSKVVGEAADAPDESEGELPAALAAFVADPEPKPSAGTTAKGLGAEFADRFTAETLTYTADSGINEMLAAPAKTFMTTSVVWAEPDDTVQRVIAKMQQNNTGYVLVGANGALEGLLSNSNILAAVSPYLRPMFAKWRRPEDDATLEIKVKWLMSRPVRTVTPNATLGSVIESMRRFGGRCLPVVDAQRQVQGIITVFDILLRVLEADKTFTWEGGPPQAPPFLI